MSQITLANDLWSELVAAAKRKQRKPEALAAKAIQDFLKRLADEDLLDRSAREAQKNGMSIGAAEQEIKRRRAGR